MITLENADKALKDYYLQAVTTQLNDNISPFFSAIEKNANNVYGRDVKISVIHGDHGSVMACAEDSELPTPHNNRYSEICVPLKNIYGTIEISDKALRASRDSSGAFVNLVNSEMDGLISSAKFNFQRMLYGDSTGAIAKLCAADKSAATNFKYILDSAKFLDVGMTVDVIATGNTKTEGLTVKSVDKYLGSVSFDKAIAGVTAGASDYDDGLGIVTLAGTYGNELTGLRAIFNDKNLYGHDKDTEPYFNPYIVQTSGTVNEATLVDLIEHMEENHNSKINMILCSYKKRRELASQLSLMRMTMNTIDANAGYGTVSVNGVPVYADRYCPDDAIYFINTDDFVLNQLCDWEWLEDEDGKILKQIPGKAAYSATLVKYAELVCKKPCAQAMLKYI